LLITFTQTEVVSTLSSKAPATAIIGWSAVHTGSDICEDNNEGEFFAVVIGLGFELRAWHCIGTLALEPHLQSILLQLFWRWGPGLTSNCDPPDLNLPRSYDYKCESLATRVKILTYLSGTSLTSLCFSGELLHLSGLLRSDFKIDFPRCASVHFPFGVSREGLASAVVQGTAGLVALTQGRVWKCKLPDR
jgi:hypothetical protein